MGTLLAKNGRGSGPYHAPIVAMNILSWNCRGLAGLATMNELKELCKFHQPAILFLMETRAPRGRVEKLQRSLKFSSMYYVDPRGLTGGLCLLWNDKVNVQIFHHSPNYIHTTPHFKNGRSILIVPLCMVIVFSNNDAVYGVSLLVFNWTKMTLGVVLEISMKC